MRPFSFYVFSVSLLFLLSFVSKGGDIQITVKDADTQNVVNGARVTLRGASTKLEDFSDNGIVKFPDIDSGHYKITASCESYLIKTKEIDFNFTDKKTFIGTITLKSISESKENQVSADNSENIGNVIFTVKDADTEEFLSGAKLTLSGQNENEENYSDNGIAEFLGIPSGKYTISVSLDGYVAKTRDIQLDFSKKMTFSGTISLQTDFDATVVEMKDAQSAFVNAEKVLKDDKEIMALINKDKELIIQARKGEVPAGDAGLIRAQAAALILAKSMKENNADMYRLAWMYAKSATETTPDDYYPWYVFGLVNIQNSRSVDAQIVAEDAFTKCLILDTDNFKAREYLAQSLYNQKLFSAAADILEEMLINSTQQPDQRLTAMLNLCYVRDGMGERGENYLKKLSEKYPSTIYVQLQLAILYNYLGKKKESDEILDQIIKNKLAANDDKDFANKLKYWNK